MPQQQQQQQGKAANGQPQAPGLSRDASRARVEYRSRDKSMWGDGAWQQEPDKVQWIDDATGLDCLIVRNHGGALCGYVGVPETHPYFGKSYDACDVEVHGGLTFADTCHEATPERWERMQSQLAKDEVEAQRFPKGDAAQRLKELGAFRDDFEGFRQHLVATAICHVPLDGQPDRVWWLGFDCSHTGDQSPAYAEYGIHIRDFETYKDIGYVTAEVRQLAVQFAAVRS